jgi:TonB family protein
MVASLLFVSFMAAAPQCTESSELCLGDQQRRLAEAAPKGSVQRRRGFEEAAQHYRRAVNLTTSTAEKVQALDRMTVLYDANHLNQLENIDPILRELIALLPNELAPIFRLAKLQEDRGFVDAAEDTLLAARHQKPDALEPYKMLAQFYARRATAMHQRTESQKAEPPAPGPGERDENGVYRVGGAVQPPQRLDRAVYPPEAVMAGVQGVVQAEVVINESGDVTDAKVLRSVPLLDEAALKAVRNWHFEPTMVNGQAVPVRMTVTVNFATR